MTNNLQLITDNYLDTRITKRVAINGVEFDEDFLASLVAAYSTRWRTRFHADGGQHSTVIADTVPR